MKTTVSDDPSTGQIDPPKLRRLAADVARDLWRALVPLVVFEGAFKCAAFLIGAIGAGWVIEPLIARTGKLAVTNTEIARFLLSPSGLLYLVLVALSLMLATMIEHVGVIAIAAAHLRGHGTTLSGTLTDLAAVFLRLITFGIRSLASLALLCAVRGPGECRVSHATLAAGHQLLPCESTPALVCGAGDRRTPGCSACGPAGQDLCGHDLRDADPPVR